MMNKELLIKVIGIAGTLLGVAATMLSDWSDDKKTEKMIEEKIKEILEQQENI